IWLRVTSPPRRAKRPRRGKFTGSAAQFRALGPISQRQDPLAGRRCRLLHNRWYVSSPPSSNVPARPLRAIQRGAAGVATTPRQSFKGAACNAPHDRPGAPRFLLGVFLLEAPASPRRRSRGPRLGLRCVGEALATEAVAECARSGSVGEAESNIELLDFVSTPTAPDWDALFTVERIDL